MLGSMKKSFRRVLTAAAICGWISLLGPQVEAKPVLVGPPPTVDGKPVELPVVKKHGRLWYPASVVSHYRKLDFAYDHATGKMYSHGTETAIETLVVDGIVYVPIAPQVTSQNQLPGKEVLKSLRPQYEEMEAKNPIKKGNTDALFQHMEIAKPNHPWAEPQVQHVGPIVDLDPTGNAQVPAHLQPGAAPPTRPAEPLPNRLSRPGTIPSTESHSIGGGPQSPTGFPSAVQETGGPPVEGGTTASSHMQPVPYHQAKQPESVAGPVALGPAVSQFAPSEKQNSVFSVAVQEAKLAESQSDTLLTVRLEQKNLSVVSQANLGNFALRCSDGSRLEPIPTRSFLPVGTLAPGQAREGELTFRLPAKAEPRSLELEGTIPLSVVLAR